MKKYKKALKEFGIAQVKLIKAMEEDFPIGSIVYYPYGQHTRSGKVNMYRSVGDDLRIESHSGALIWISARQITRVI